MIFFTIQVYCDFSGYSDIAIGTARLFGFSLMKNFAFPYFSRNYAEFWQRWHISLSSWFRDYVFFPLGGSKVRKSAQARNIIITYGLSGFWHGASWNYVIWGLLHAMYYLPLIFIKERSKYTGIVAENRKLPTFKELFQILLTFSLLVFSLIFFRTPNLEEAFQIILALPHLWSIQSIFHFVAGYGHGCLLVSILLLFEWSNRKKEHPFELSDYRRRYRWMYYLLAFVLLIYFGSYDTKQQYIYFQF
jgi:D-alanyl-lipoteichoic acid acyltransferase DltB (MBOAT superfamily)